MNRIGLIQFPGSNCERETALAVKRAGMQPVEFLWNEPLDQLTAFDGYILIGGFSYEDRSRAGIIAALDPVLNTIKQQSALGKPVLGICNGAQILLEAGLLSAIDNQFHPLALTENKRIVDGKIIGTGFYNAWVNLRLASIVQNNAFTRCLKPNEIITVPSAHAQGRFVMSEASLQAMQTQGLAVFHYCDEQGQVMNNFPINPNGSVANIAAVINQAGNVMAIMPHPERSANGDAIFNSMRQYIDAGYQATHRTPPEQAPVRIATYSRSKPRHELIVKLIITDNEAMTVQKTLNQLGIPAVVNRFVHWQIDCDDETFMKIRQSDVLYCQRKEYAVVLEPNHRDQSLTYLVRAKEDVTGQQALQIMGNDYGLAVNHIQHGILWQFSSKVMPAQDLINDVLYTNIIGNHHAHEVYYYGA